MCNWLISLLMGIENQSENSKHNTIMKKLLVERKILFSPTQNTDVIPVFEYEGVPSLNEV